MESIVNKIYLMTSVAKRLVWSRVRFSVGRIWETNISKLVLFWMFSVVPWNKSVALVLIILGIPQVLRLGNWCGGTLLLLIYLNNIQIIIKSNLYLTYGLFQIHSRSLPCLVMITHTKILGLNIIFIYYIPIAIVHIINK